MGIIQTGYKWIEFGPSTESMHYQQEIYTQKKMDSALYVTADSFAGENVAVFCFMMLSVMRIITLHYG